MSDQWHLHVLQVGYSGLLIGVFGLLLLEVPPATLESFAATGFSACGLGPVSCLGC